MAIWLLTSALIASILSLRLQTLNSLLCGFLSESLLIPVLEFRRMQNPRYEWRHGWRLSFETNTALKISVKLPSVRRQRNDDMFLCVSIFCCLLVFTKTVTCIQQENWHWKPVTWNKLIKATSVTWISQPTLRDPSGPEKAVLRIRRTPKHENYCNWFHQSSYKSNEQQTKDGCSTTHIHLQKRAVFLDVANF